jgi:hypothetical protein
MYKVIISLYYQAKNNLTSMKVSEMSLSDRIKYEKALTELDAMKQLIDRIASYTEKPN